jgi:LysR family transcriptional regulator, regulator for metE and metH
LTVAILQLVASGRGVPALPGWTVQPYLDRQYVIARTIRRKGLFSQLYAATTKHAAKLSYIQEFIETTKAISFSTLQGIVPV